MYTRRYPSASRRTPVPPPDYSGTALLYPMPEQIGSAPDPIASPKAEQGGAHVAREIIPPLPAVEGEVMAKAVPEYGKLPPDAMPFSILRTEVHAKEQSDASRDEALHTSAPSADPAGEVQTDSLPTASDTSPTPPQAEEPSDPRLRGGASRRPDLGAPPEGRALRFSRRSPRPFLPRPPRPINQTRRPLGVRQGEGGFFPPPRRAVFAGARKPRLESDDLLLLGVLFLLFNGGEGAVREHLDLILLIGFLFFIGKEEEKERFA